MSTVDTLLLTLAILHVAEGLFWVRRRAVVFFDGLRPRVVRPNGPLGDADRAFVFANPLSPWTARFVVEPWPITFATDVAWSHPAESFGATAVDARDCVEVPLDGARVQDRSITVAGRVVASTSSAVAARAVVALLRRLHETRPSARAHVLDEAVAAQFDLTAVKARLAELRRASIVSGVLAALVPVMLLGGTFAFFFVHEVAVRWPWLLGAIGAVLMASWIAYFVAHRRLYPELASKRGLDLVMMVFSFPAAAHARAWLARDALAEFHPLAVAAVVLDEAAFAVFAGAVWRDARHPLQVPEPAREAVRAMRERLRAAVEALLVARGLDPAALERPPAERNASAYCPRCLAAYTAPSGACEDCPGVMLKVC